MLKPKKSLTYSIILLGLLTLMTLNASAKTVVFVHGYLASSHDWRNKQVIVPLVHAGWLDGGNYYPAQQDNMYYPPDPKLANRKPPTFFTVDVPSTEPIERQADYLSMYLEHLYQLRREPIILVGHSAGGVVARAYLVRQNIVPIKALVTIASPHLGTPLADLGIMASMPPMSDMLQMIGIGDLAEYRRVLDDLRDASNQGYLHWLNHQVHPDIPYVSIIRSNIDFANTDIVVPKESQDMNNVTALRGTSLTFEAPGDHFLNIRDGQTLLRLFEDLK